MNHIHSQPDKFGRPRGYVGHLKFNRKIEWKGRVVRADELAGSIGPASRKELRRGDERQWYFTRTVHIPKVNHKAWIVIIWERDQTRNATPCELLVIILFCDSVISLS